MRQEEYLNLYFSVHIGKQQSAFNAVRTVLENYANPPVYFYNPTTWFYQRTWSAVVLGAIEKALSTPTPSISLLLQFLSEQFNNTMREQLNPDGDFMSALLAIQQVIHGLVIHQYPSEKPFLELREDTTPFQLASLRTATQNRHTSRDLLHSTIALRSYVSDENLINLDL
jgi:hypothetical protein